MMSQPPERLRHEAESLRDWLFNAALPLWWAKGADHVNGGFEELLDLNGAPVAAPRRARVQARQIYVYATAGAMGWDGPWQAAVDHGLNYFLTRYFRPDGLVHAAVSASGEPGDDDVPVLYDQAFGLLALASAEAASGGVDMRDRARHLIEAVDHRFGAKGPGCGSGDPARPFQSNPHMHLFEACLAWMERDPSPIWRDLGARIADLAMTCFIDSETGGLREFFDETWAPAAGIDGTIVEPGHQFEWAWLLYRWGHATGDPAATAAADRLFEIGAGHGIDPTRKVAINALDDTFSPLDTSARLWPQTERVKAAVLAAEVSPSLRERRTTELLNGVDGLRRYLLPNGVWRDKLTPENRFIEEPAPASSFYHIIGAIAEVNRAARSSIGGLPA